MRAYTVSDFRRDMRDGRLTMPGRYPRFFLMSDGECLSFEAARENRRLILDSIANCLNDGWRIVGCDINWEDADMVCCHSGQKIESAYAD